MLISNFQLFFGLVLLLVVSSIKFTKISGESADESIILDKPKMLELLSEKDFVFIAFHVPWCGHCKKMLPEFEAASVEMKNSHIIFAKFDVEKDSSLVNELNIAGYPTIRLYKRKTMDFTEYTGERVKDAFIKWLNFMTSDNMIVHKTKEEAFKEAENHEIVFIGLFNDVNSVEYTKYKNFADSHREYGIYFSAINEGYTNELYVYRKSDGLTGPSSIKDDPEYIFLEKEKFNLFGPINSENYMNYFSSAKPILWYIGEKKDYNNIYKTVQNVARNLRSELYAVWLDIAQFKYHAEHSLGIRDYPVFLLQNGESKYLMDTKIQYTEASVLSFTKNALSGKVERYLLSQDIPATNDEPIKVIVTKTFNELVFQKDKDVILTVVAPWCGYCSEFLVIYEDLAKQLAHESHLYIAKMDGTANESPSEHFKWKGFPTVFFVKANTQVPIIYEGNRSIDSIVEFINQHSMKPVKYEFSANTENDEL